MLCGALLVSSVFSLFFFMSSPRSELPAPTSYCVARWRFLSPDATLPWCCSALYRLWRFSHHFFFLLRRLFLSVLACALATHFETARFCMFDAPLSRLGVHRQRRFVQRRLLGRSGADVHHWPASDHYRQRLVGQRHGRAALPGENAVLRVLCHLTLGRCKPTLPWMVAMREPVRAIRTTFTEAAQTTVSAVRPTVSLRLATRPR